ncbi:MAG: alanine racemase [Chitinispirillaceae bacterium]
MENSRTKARIIGMISPYSPHIEISLDNLLHNLGEIRSVLPSKAGIIAVVKDCSYGCGSGVIARTLEQKGGVEFFAVARAEEAFALRKAGVHRPVLVLGRSTEEQLRAGLDRNIVFALNDPSDLYRWKSYPFNVRFHLNIDTGMNRLGLLPSELDEMLGILEQSTNLHPEGVFTHMACADVPGTSTVQNQLSSFSDCIERLRQAGVSPLHVHYGNSATFMRFPLEECTLVRPGIALYGCRPDPAQEWNLKLRPVASLISRVVKMKKVPAGTPVSYGGNYVTPTETWIATVAMGYAHGLPRFLSSKGEVLIGYRRYKIAGNVTMDYIMVDAGPNPDISVGDEAVAMGTQGEDAITPDQIALLGNTIGYEVLCNLGTAIDRVYLLEDQVVHHEPGIIF